MTSEIDITEQFFHTCTKDKDTEILRSLIWLEHGPSILKLS